MSKAARRRISKLLKARDARYLDSLYDDIRRKRNLEEVEAELLGFARANPDVVESWTLLMELADASKDARLAWQATRQLLELEPDEPGHLANAAVLSAQLVMPFSALHYAETYLSRFPKGAQIRQIRALHDIVAQECERLLREDEMAKAAEDSADLRLFEEGQLLVTIGNYAEGRRVSQLAAKRLPHMPAPLNNVSLSYAVEGRLDEALKTTRQVLAQYPDNLHARCNLAQYLVRLGHADEARPILDALRAETPANADHWDKILETLAYAGDDESLVEFYRRAEAALREKKLEVTPLAQHFAAASHARLGQADEARKLWKAALKQNPGLQIAQNNLDDLRKPVGERNGAWHFPFQQWVAQSWVQRLEAVLSRNVRRSEQKLQTELTRIIESFTPLRCVLPILLERGDPAGREFVLHMANFYPVEGLVEFALGQRGTDQMRMQAAQFAANWGKLDRSQPVRLYTRGEPNEVRLLNIEIYSEPDEASLPDPAQAHLEASFEAMSSGNPKQALEEAEAGLQLMPDHQTFLNHKAAALMALRRTRDAEAVIRHMADLYPDYLFARCAMAQLCARDGKLDEAQEWLKPLMLRERFHRSEFNALAQANIELLKARGDRQGAESWQQMAQSLLRESD